MERIGENGCACTYLAPHDVALEAGEPTYSAACRRHGDGAEDWCHRCGGDNISWSAPSPLWNRIMRGDNVGGKEPWDGIICPTCFAVLTEQEGVGKMWLLFPQVVLAELKVVTPDGRAWNPDTWKWEDPVSFSARGMEH